MPEKVLYEYAVIRIVPRVEKEEFFNAGVILYCKDRKYLNTITHLNLKKLSCFAPDADVEEINAHLNAYEQIAKGESKGGPIARLDMASRFRWLTATRSTMVQSSQTHSGYCEDPEKALEDLFEKYIGK